MKHKAYKFFLDFEKEERWLNQMAAKGYHMIDISFPGRYLFEEGEPGEFIYRIELLKELPTELESKAYIKFMEETGAECVSTYTRWAYFRRKIEDGPFELYTDTEAKLQHYRRIAWMFGIIGLANLLIGTANILISLLISRSNFNMWISPISFGAGLLMAIPFFLTWQRIRRLKKEAQIYQ
ncbi:MAG: DUF2812 domain-containing protein [Firmicutes bacterium]|nr:DUF2812 domain-containing protein [Bacillota bacterium]